MSRTTDQRRTVLRCTCNLPDGFLHEMDDSLRSLSEVTQSLNLIESLLDPLATGGRPVIEVDREQLSALLRILNSAFSSKLNAAHDALHTAMQ